MRTVLCTIFILLAISVPGRTQEPSASTIDLSGVYECRGVSQNDKAYEGFVEIFKNGEIYFIHWIIGSGHQFGVGFVRDGKLIVGFADVSTGVGVYKIEPDAKLTGEWTAFSTNGQVFAVESRIYTESWTKTSEDKIPQSEPSPSQKKSAPDRPARV